MYQQINVPAVVARLSPSATLLLLSYFFFTAPVWAKTDSENYLFPKIAFPGDTSLEAQICANEIFNFNGQLLSQSGTYTDTLTASDGTDSVVTLELIVLPLSFSETEAQICEGDNFVFNGITYTESGTYKATLTGENGCDSIATLVLEVLPNLQTELYVEQCAGTFYIFGGDTLRVAGRYFDFLIGAGGCDSTVILDLVFVTHFETGLSVTLCPGDSVIYNGLPIFNSGVFSDTLTAVGGCDSIITLTVNVLNIPTTQLSINQCIGTSYFFNGENLTTDGAYTDTLAATSGCDSVVVLTLKFVDQLETNLHISICKGDLYFFNGQVITDAGMYSDTLKATLGGCDSILFLKLDVLNHSASNFSETICSNETYSFNGQTLSQSGTYTAVLPAANGCDSTVTLILEVLPTASGATSATICTGKTFDFHGQTLSQSGTYTATLTAENGCDSVVTLTLDVLPNSVYEETVSICAGQTYNFNGQDFGVSGNYSFNFPAANGCDSTAILHLTVLPQIKTNLSATICSNETYPFDGQTLSQSGTYTASLTAENGCDSTVTLTLTVLPTTSSSLSATICSNETYPFNGQLLAQAGTYSATLTAKNGCDSVVTLTLGVLPTAASEINATICEGGAIHFNGQTISQAGTYTATLTAANGCDSVVTLNLALLPSSVYEETVSICAGQTYNFNGQDFGTSGDYSFVFPAANGCDSTATLHLTVFPEIKTNVAASICSNETYPFNGQTLSQSGTYTANLTAENGCDSTVTLTLRVLPTASSSVAATICSNETYPFNGQLLAQAGTYTATLTAANGCDSVVTLILAVLPTSGSQISATICANKGYPFFGQILSQPGTYTGTLTAKNGCDSIITLTLNVLPTAATAVSATICAGETYIFNGQSFDQSGSYTFSFTGANGCDSSSTLHLTVLPVVTTDIAANICQNSTYQFNGQTLSQSGTYTATLTAANGCDSTVTLTLTTVPFLQTSLSQAICRGGFFTFDGQNLTQAGVYTDTLTAVAGCDSILTLTLTVFEHSASQISAKICKGESYNFNGQQLSNSGNYTATLTNWLGCDSVVTLSLAVLPKVSSEAVATICEGGGYPFFGQILSQSGTYTATLTGPNGCDSIIHLTLTVLPKASSQNAATICAGETYGFNGQNLNQSGTYTATLTAANGCDSVATLVLTVLPVATSTTTATICAGESFAFNGLTLTQSGTYTADLTTPFGCDSIATLVLTVLPNYSTQLAARICRGETYPFQGQSLSQSGTYTANLTASNGCDSTVTLTLTVLPNSQTQLSARICEGETYVFNNQPLTQPGIYTAVFPAANGCDSTVFLALIVSPTAMIQINASLCPGETYAFNGQTLSQSGTYAATLQGTNGCDSVVTLNLVVKTVDNAITQMSGQLVALATNATFQWFNCATNQAIAGATQSTYTPTVTGSYGVWVTQNGCTLASVCETVIVISTGEPLSATDWLLAPNPAADEVWISFEKTTATALRADVFDASGRLLHSFDVAQGTEKMRLDLAGLPAGMLALRLSDGRGVSSKRFVKVE